MFFIAKCLNFLFYRYAQLRYIGVVNWQRKQYIVIAALAFHVRDELFCVKPVLENRDFLKKYLLDRKYWQFTCLKYNLNIVHKYKLNIYVKLSSKYFACKAFLQPFRHLPCSTCVPNSHGFSFPISKTCFENWQWCSHIFLVKEKRYNF